MHGKPAIVIIKKKVTDEVMPDYSSMGYYEAKKSMADAYMDDEYGDVSEESTKLEADPKHKGTIKKLEEVVAGLRKASKTHAGQADTLEGVIATLQRTPDDD